MPTQATLPFDLYESTKTFEEYDKENPQIWQAFKRLTFQLIAVGVKHWGAKAIMEQLRYETIIRGKGDYKINNNYTAGYARKFSKEFPKYKDFFEIREKNNERRY